MVGRSGLLGHIWGKGTQGGILSLQNLRHLVDEEGICPNALRTTEQLLFHFYEFRANSPRSMTARCQNKAWAWRSSSDQGSQTRGLQPAPANRRWVIFYQECEQKKKWSWLTMFKTFFYVTRKSRFQGSLKKKKENLRRSGGTTCVVVLRTLDKDTLVCCIVLPAHFTDFGYLVLWIFDFVTLVPEPALLWTS